MNEVNKGDTLGLKPFYPGTGLLYKYVSVETAMKIIQFTSLKFSKAVDFNDPFELTFDAFDYETTDDDLRRLVDRALKNAPYQEKEAYYNEVIKNKHLAKDAIIGNLNSFKDTVGICCFSKRYDKVLMWSHYANNHQGVCLGFDLPYNSEMPIYEVKYAKSIPNLNYWKMDYKALPIWSFTKSEIWEYEEEVRALHTEINGLVRFEKGYLKEIHYGLRTTTPDIAMIEAMLSLKDYRADNFQMNINPKTFDIIRVPL